MEDKNTIIVKVAAGTPVAQLAGSLKAKYDELKEGQSIAVRCVGSVPVNQAIKAIIVLNQFLAREGFTCSIHPSLIPSFEPIHGKGVSENITVTVLALNFKRIQ
jgi:stage V sporulation protein SpoVS